MSFGMCIIDYHRRDVVNTRELSFSIMQSLRGAFCCLNLRTDVGSLCEGMLGITGQP